MDIEPFKALSDSEREDYESGPPYSPSMDGERFGTYLAYAVAVVLFLLFAVGSCKG